MYIRIYILKLVFELLVILTFRIVLQVASQLFFFPKNVIVKYKNLRF